MDNRLEVLREKVDGFVNRIEPGKRRYFFVHLYGVSHFGALLALRRGADAEIASACGMLHDIYPVISGSYENHAALGATEAEMILKSTGLFSDREIEIITAAISNHSAKNKVDSIYDEILKDADVLHHCLYNPGFLVAEHEKERFQNILTELGCHMKPNV